MLGIVGARKRRSADAHNQPGQRGKVVIHVYSESLTLPNTLSENGQTLPDVLQNCFQALALRK